MAESRPHGSVAVHRGPLHYAYDISRSETVLTKNAQEPRAVDLGVVALDERDLIRCLVREIVVLLLGIVVEEVNATIAIGVNEASWNEVLRQIEGLPVGNRKRSMRHRVANRTPDVDQSHSRL